MYSKWPEVCLVQNATSSKIISFLDRLFSREGIPESVLSDNGSAFCSKEFSEYCDSKGIKRIRTSLYNPQCNAVVERFNSNLSTLFAACRIDKTDTHRSLNSMLSVYRSTTHSVTGFSPSLLLHGKEMKTVLPVSIPRKKVRFDLPSVENPFSVGDPVKLLHPRSKKIILCLTVNRTLGPKAVLLSDGRKWNIRFLSKNKKGKM